MAAMGDMFLCPNCGDMFTLVQLSRKSGVRCRSCSYKTTLAELSASSDDKPVQVHFKKTLLRCQLDSKYARRIKGYTVEALAVGSEPKEAIVDEECEKCHYPRCSYHTKQLRGLDEGQTIFYTCLNPECGHKFIVHS